MDVTASIQTQPGGGDNDRKRKKTIAFVAILFIVLSITAWFFIQPLLVGEKAADAAPIAKNPNKSKAPVTATADEKPDSTAKDATTVATTDPAIAAPTDAPKVETPATNTGEASVDSPAVENPVGNSATTPAPTIAPAADAIIPPPPVPVTTAAPENAPVEPFAQEPKTDRWEKLRADNPGTTLPSNEMWVFQTRKLKSKIYNVKSTESLKTISSKLLYSDRFWVKIWSLNPNVVDPEAVPAGTEIYLDPAARETASH